MKCKMLLIVQFFVYFIDAFHFMLPPLALVLLKAGGAVNGSNRLPHFMFVLYRLV